MIQWESGKFCFVVVGDGEWMNEWEEVRFLTSCVNIEWVMRLIHAPPLRSLWVALDFMQVSDVSFSFFFLFGSQASWVTIYRAGDHCWLWLFGVAGGPVLVGWCFTYGYAIQVMKPYGGTEYESEKSTKKSTWHSFVKDNISIYVRLIFNLSQIRGKAGSGILKSSRGGREASKV